MSTVYSGSTPVSPSQASWGLSAQPPGFRPPTKHARRRSQLIHGSDVHANSSVDTQYVTDSRPWWSTEAPVSAPILGSFQDAVGPAASIDPSPITVTAKPQPFAATSLPLHKQHAELLQSIAQEEARCAELRGQLAVREARLAGLKQRWEDRRAERWGDRASAVGALKQQTEEVSGDTEKVPGEEEMEGDEDEGKDRESILEETMRKLEGRKVNDSDSDKPGNVVKSEDRFPASSSLSASIRSSFISTTPATDPASPASSSTSSLSSSSSSFGGIREARRWMHRRPDQLRPAATPGLNAVRERAVRAASFLYCERATCLHCKRALRLRIWTPSEMTIFAPEEEWIWAWYFVGR
ncbi:hypothetical protein K525DRAFT_291899 [Schizophyllum commune Loenen D]|nr:hypothetical protein K525DRAFT_291899 [Schizophyllum commune Loenen D]